MKLYKVKFFAILNGKTVGVCIYRHAENVKELVDSVIKDYRVSNCFNPDNPEIVEIEEIRIGEVHAV